MMTEESKSLRLPVEYVGVDEVPINYATTFVIQNDRDAFILTLAQIVSPLLIGSEEEQRRQAEQIPYVPAKVLARVVLTHARLKSLASVLNRHLERFEREEAQGALTADDDEDEEDEDA